MAGFRLIACAEARVSLKKDVSKQDLCLKRYLSGGIS